MTTSPFGNSAGSRRRFVILHHRVGSGLSRTTIDHLDWMFEVENSLCTFTSEVIDVSPTQLPVTIGLRRIADHRSDYLNFEGLMAGNRGTVTRLVWGEYCADDSDTCTRLRFQCVGRDDRKSAINAAAYLMDGEFFACDKPADWILRLSTVRYETNW